MTTKKILSAFCFLLLGLSLKAQQGAVSAGAEATGAGGTVSYTIGQIDYITATSADGTITQGIQQPYEILVQTGIEQTGVTVSSSVYPNPTADFVTLSIENTDFRNMSYALFDLNGKLVAQQKITSNSTTIQLAGLPDAVYFIRILNNNSEIKSFKIIKNN